MACLATARFRVQKSLEASNFMTALVNRRTQGDVVILTLNAPEVRNAMSLAMRKELLEALREAMASPDSRVVVLTGAEGHFCSGGQIQPSNGAGTEPDPQRTLQNISLLHDIVRILAVGAKPTVAAVEGSAYGAGLSLAAACDYLVAGENARFCASFGKIGLMPDTGLIWSLPQRVGPTRARDIMLSGRVVDAQEAGATGLANVVVPNIKVIDTALGIADNLVKMAPLALATMKTVLARGPESLEKVLSAEAELQPMLTLTQDYAEGKMAFKEKRPPVFRGV
jgi:enoyl-CoA hydratase/carnithine racemase